MYEGLKREYEIMTLGTAVWHVNEYQVMDVEEASHGQFHEGDTYVVRWQYMIMQTGRFSFTCGGGGGGPTPKARGIMYNNLLT